MVCKVKNPAFFASEDSGEPVDEANMIMATSIPT